MYLVIIFSLMQAMLSVGIAWGQEISFSDDFGYFDTTRLVEGRPHAGT